jgi:hypothetical protein
MKTKITTIACIAPLLLASLSRVEAATTLTAWTFDNLALGANGSPQPSAGFGSAGALGMSNSYNSTNSVSNPDVQSLAGSSSGGANSWRIRGSGTAPNGGNGWSSSAPIGSQGARFAGSTAGYYRIKVSFDVYATPDAEANLQVQYTTEGTIWRNAAISSVGTLGVIASNSSTSNSTVVGSYVILTSNGTTGWNKQLTVDLSGVSGVDNNPSFAVRMVNASTGTNCVDTTGAPYNNTSGSWTFDNVVIQGTAIDAIATWTFDSNGTTNYVPHPVPEFGAGYAAALGFDTSFVFSDGSVGSTNAPDTLVQAGSSTPSAPICWRVRGQGPGNGWNTQSPIGSQGAEFDVSTVNYSNIVLSFDLYFTSQAEAKMCVLYTTDNWVTTSNATMLAYGANPTFIETNPDPSLGGSPDTVVGTYFYQTVGQNWYNNLVVDFTGVPGVDNNPNFGIRIVNAAQGADCVAFNGGSYNNSSGNCRYDNVTIGGEFNGSIPPALAYDPNATVDRPFTNTFADDPTWRSKITAIYVNGAALTNSAYTTNVAGQIVFNPTNSALLQSSGTKTIVIYATGYSSAKVTQPLAAGAAAKLAITSQPAAPAASGGTLLVNPVLAITDKYGNGSTNPYANVSVTASVGGSGGWTLGGAATQPAVNGIMAFTNLSATVNGSSAVSGASITFTLTGYAPLSTTNSATFNIGKPPATFTAGNLAVIQLDTVANNTTFSMIEVKPSAAGQTTPVNIIPISATGTNALRLCSAGSCGKLSLSDDGTLLSFVGFADGSSATPDETLVLNRAVGTLNYTNQFTSPLSYTSISLGGSQGRSCCTLDNTNWIVIDKGGLYINDFLWSLQNNVVARAFGGIPFIETQKTAGGSPIPAVYALLMDNPASINSAIPNNLPTDPVAVDFYLISTNVLYVLDSISSASGVIKKYSLTVGDDGHWTWNSNGAFTNTTGGDGLFATTNGSGATYLYYTTAASSKNSIIRLTDASGYGAPINIISSNVIYTASGSTYVKGLTFAPQQTPYATELIPPPILTAQSGAKVSSLFYVTNTPDDPTWRSAITSITVNGTLLPPAAYSASQAGQLAFDPSKSALLQTAGTKTIVITATGYSPDSVSQALTFGQATKLVVTTQPTAPLGNGGALVTQPVVKVEDVYGNVVTNSSASVAATAAQATWTLGGTTTKAVALGVATFSDLTAISAQAVTGASISFSSSGLTGAASAAFNIPAPINSLLVGAGVSGGKFGFSFTNITGLSYSVLATNKVAAPVSTWPVIGHPTETPAGSGHYQYTEQNPATNGALYYYLRQP